MAHLTLHRPDQTHAVALPLPEPRCGEIHVRPAVASDFAFVDQLQKMHSKMVGWMPTKQLGSYIQRGQVLIAEENVEASKNRNVERSASHDVDVSTFRRFDVSMPVGYCIARDKYDHREELGIVYQLNVLPMKQRGLIGATLLKEVFHRAAYGCKLFCCWCAQDLEANHFWESMGFIPLAFRTGSRKAGRKKTSGGPRIHIFWQRRIREGDDQTPYWFPSETSGGAVRENRLVLPIPPGTHWSDAKPAVLPGMGELHEPRALASGAVEGDAAAPLPHGRGSSRRKKKEAKPKVPPAAMRGGLWFAPPPPPPEPPLEEIAKAKDEKKKARPKFRNDPKLVAAARELRDRYIEQINAPEGGLLLPPSAYGKYNVSRQLEAAPSNFVGGRGRGAMKIESGPKLEASGVGR